MSEPTPTRTISGFGPPPTRRTGVHPDASRLLAKNRTTAPATAPTATPGPQHPAPPPPAAAESTSPPSPEEKPTPVRTRAKEQLNVTVPVDARARIRAAYRATSAAEGHRSFGDLVTALLEAEAERLEHRYNNGQRFTGGNQPLPSGRPLGD